MGWLIIPLNLSSDQDTMSPLIRKSTHLHMVSLYHIATSLYTLYLIPPFHRNNIHYLISGWAALSFTLQDPTTEISSNFVSSYPYNTSVLKVTFYPIKVWEYKIDYYDSGWKNSHVHRFIKPKSNGTSKIDRLHSLREAFPGSVV